ncbi:hypothetical protein VKT23_000150 [Stygiomarasmius scandens]|uniref:Uncharacterized protein n=1 Tax=Marasmiellus scandens TaxID=2682957 RepID=A0ABR1K600_9AGAR
MATSNSASSKYYRSPGSLPDETTQNTSSAKYYRSSKPATSLSLSEIFQPIPPDLSQEDRSKWIENMWKEAREARIDVEEFSRQLRLQRMTKANGRTRDEDQELQHQLQNVDADSNSTERPMHSSCSSDPEPPQAHLPPRVSSDASISDEALTQVLVQFFHDWNSNHSGDWSYTVTDSQPTASPTVPSDMSLASSLQRVQSQYQSQTTPASGTFSYPGLTRDPPAMPSPAPFAYRSPEELAELQRVKIIPGSRYR